MKVGLAAAYCSITGLAKTVITLYMTVCLVIILPKIPYTHLNVKVSMRIGPECEKKLVGSFH